MRLNPTIYARLDRFLEDNPDTTQRAVVEAALAMYLDASSPPNGGVAHAPSTQGPGT